ncbi:MAG: tetratricopeptide repeat protein [Bacteroidales bacterium]|nr:tetratricopeptide repeat protein [Bacteroidales bacterium]
MNKCRFIFCVTCIVLFPCLLGAQGYAYKSIRGEVERVRDLFVNDMHQAVQNEVALLLSKDLKGVSPQLLAELESYGVISGICLKHSNIDGLVSGFQSRYPNSPRLAPIKFHQSVYYFDEGNYAKSLSIINGIENKYLSKQQRWTYMFNKAYSNMRVGNNNEAKAGFRQILSLGDTPYKAPSHYYLGYLNYISGDFEKALREFKVLENNNDYSLLSKYYMAESYFMMKEYGKAIEVGEEIYQKLEGDFKMKCVRILSQSYYELNDSRQAKRYLEMYSAESDRMSRKDNYYSGVVSYSLGSYYAAIDAFVKVVGLKDSLAQNGFLYLGNSYLGVKNKLNAMGAFKEAATMEYDRTIQEEASFLYAKLAFDLNSDIEPFNAYIEKYPSTQKGDEIYSYIAASYLQSKNFKDAVSALGNVRKMTPEMVHNLQKAAFFRGMQLMSVRSYRSAIENFDLSVANGLYNASLTSLAKFWKGEALYRVNDFDGALTITSPLVQSQHFASTDEYPMALMNMGYSHFMLGNYSAAKVWFEKYLQLPAHKKIAFVEAKTRLADCWYMEKNYEESSVLYQDVATRTFSKDDIYATYMGALSYGLVGQPQKKISMLKDIIDKKSTSSYYHKSLYELGRTYVQEEANDDAIECFNALLQDKSDSTYRTKSMLELGMIHSNLSKYDMALNYFTAIVEKYPLSEDVMSALAGIESVYQLLNKPDKYLAYLDKVGMSSVKSADEKEQMLFNGAEQLFLAERYSEALGSLESFIEKYPEGAKTPQAYFYLAEAYRKTGKPEFASDAYLKVMNTGEGAFVELATLYYGQLQLELEEYGKAAYAFESLETISKLENNKKEAAVGKMRGYYGARNFEKCIAAADVVLASGFADVGIQREAEYKKAKSYYSLGQRGEAILLFGKLAKDYTSAEGAESAYLLIQNAYDEGDFAKVENLVYAFSDAGTSHMYWLAKSFIVLGDSFAERDEWEQAKATFESVKEGYKPEKDYDDVLEQVEMRLLKLNENGQ